MSNAAALMPVSVSVVARGTAASGVNTFASAELGQGAATTVRHKVSTVGALSTMRPGQVFSTRTSDLTRALAELSALPRGGPALLQPGDISINVRNANGALSRWYGAAGGMDKAFEGVVRLLRIAT